MPFAFVAVVILVYYLFAYFFMICPFLRHVVSEGKVTGRSLGQSAVSYSRWVSSWDKAENEPSMALHTKPSPTCPWAISTGANLTTKGQGTAPVSLGPAQDRSGLLCFCASSRTVEGGLGVHPPGAGNQNVRIPQLSWLCAGQDELDTQGLLTAAAFTYLHTFA